VYFLENEEVKTEVDELKKRRQALESKREALLIKLKKIDSQAKYKSYEARALHTVLKGKRRPDTRMLKRRLDILEFKIQTEASTLNKERQFMKEIKKTQKELEEAIGEDRQFKKLAYLESDLREYEKEMDSLEQELQTTNTEISDMEKSFRDKAKRHVLEERTKKRNEAKEKKRGSIQEESKKENEPYMAKMEPTVTLEDICVIKKRDKTTQEE